MKKHILITGGAGFIGRNLIHHLISNDLAASIRVIDNESTAKASALSDFDVDFHSADIRDKAAVSKALTGIDAVVHLAADTRVIDSIEDPSFNFENNVVGTFNLMMAMRDKGVHNFVNASTGGAIIGEVTPPVHEEMLPKPLSPYGASKLAVEGYCSAFSAVYGFKTVSLRFGNVYGPLSLHKGSVVAAFMRKVLARETLTIYGDGEQTRDYIFTGDLCKGIVAALMHDESDVFQIATGKPTSINQLISVIRSSVSGDYDVDVNYEPARAGEITHTYCEVSKAKSQLGFEATTTLSDGIGQTWRWFLDTSQKS